ncbi:11-cis retinol dehydrogenase, partial [Plakobranchus ocellatus]
MELTVIAFGALILLFMVTMILFLTRQLRRPPLNKATGFKAVLITGCDQGFGYLLAKRLDGAGYKVFAGCLKANEDGPKRLKAETSPKLEILQLDVTKEDQIEAARSTVADSLEGHVMWAVVNNAGVGSHVEFELTLKSYFRRMIDVNLMGVVNVTRAFLPLVRAAKGRIINIASMAGRTGLPGFSAYSASKFGVIGFSECLRREMRHFGVKIILVEPFVYKTSMGTAENILNQNDIFWERAEPGVKRDYGEHFFTKTQ